MLELRSSSDERLEIAGLKLARGERFKTKLRAVELVDGSSVELPAMIIQGSKPGPVFYLGSAFHGDEVNGVAIVSRFIKEVDPRNLRGTIIVVPAQNPPALQVQHRYNLGHMIRSPLDQSPADPWVCFPGDDKGNMASMIAHTLYSELMQHADYMVDIHTPTTGGRYAPFAFLAPPSAGSSVEEAALAAKAFGADFILSTGEGVYVQDTSPHVVMSKRGSVAFGLEIGEGGQVDPAITEIGLNGLRRMLGQLGMLETEAPVAGRGLTIASMTPVRSSRGGLMHRHAQLNQDLKKGDLIATITDLFGEVVEEVRAPHDGPVVRTTTFPAVSAGERIVQLGVAK